VPVGGRGGEKRKKKQADMTKGLGPKENDNFISQKSATEQKKTLLAGAEITKRVRQELCEQKMQSQIAHKQGGRERKCMGPKQTRAKSRN